MKYTNVKKYVILIVFVMGALLSITTLSLSVFDGNLIPKVTAQATPSTSVNVDNSAPTFTVAPAESPASHSGVDRTNIGDTITFTATATDSNGEDYYLAICRTDSITAGSAAAPTCAAGETICVTDTAQTSASSHSCDYTIQESESSDTYTWYAFVCDHLGSGAQCSASSQGTGNSGSPYYVNHRPTLTSATDGGDISPNGSTAQDQTFTTVSSDTDTDQIQVFVCGDDTGLNGTNTACAGTQICTSSLTANNPSCTDTAAVAAVEPHESRNYWVHIVDSLGLDNTAASVVSSSYEVLNTTPSVSSTALNSGSDMTLTSIQGTTDFTVTGTVTDYNSCQDITTVTTSVYRTVLAYAGCDTVGEADNNDCYPIISCSVSGGTCTGSTDASADYSCTVSIQYHADPTVTGTPLSTDTWMATMYAADGSSNSTTDSSTVEMNSFVALTMSSNIDYGSMSAGESMLAVDNPVTNVLATGNTQIDVNLSGTSMTGPGDPIVASQQEYNINSSFNHGTGTDLSGTPTTLDANIGKTTTSGSPANKNVYWALEIPAAQTGGAYTGTNTFTAIISVLPW